MTLLSVRIYPEMIKCHAENLVADVTYEKMINSNFLASFIFAF